jgi:hypothetical protein
MSTIKSDLLLNKKQKLMIPYNHKRHEAYQHNTASRLEGVVKNIGIKPVRKEKKK